MSMTVTLIVEKTDTGFSAYSQDTAIFTTAQTVPELINNSYEAANLYYEDENVELGPGDILFEIDFKQFFKYYKVLNAKFLAEKIGMNATLLSQYVQGHKKPSSKQTKKILNGINQIGQELSGINLLQPA
ncbi:helix-turn-helix domain-containing protein [Phaeocystidibacter luteus]|uniref:Helix-turn-helix transcriptional regulator n=1 Tax=Phaeocystidibacter luteus TaxID=911197 RepID=A0A6N6REX0_9FLAO|nr:helix-turn-helix transcriptional regulator [Phaeocystidibacter luteus]KAB2807368.1 helix-turn-helix transcriptional regulator [Phaeocystidibacter luteus]